MWAHSLRAVATIFTSESTVDKLVAHKTTCLIEKHVFAAIDRTSTSTGRCLGRHFCRRRRTGFIRRRIARLIGRCRRWSLCRCHSQLSVVGAL